MNKNGLDEMQRDRRNRIGHQMFMIMFYALLIDAGLSGFGIHWLNYPVNIMVIIVVCMSVYLIRLIAANAYLPPKASIRRSVISLVIAVALSVALVIAPGDLFGNLPSGDLNFNSAVILFIVSAVGLLVSLVVAILRKVNDKADGED